MEADPPPAAAAAAVAAVAAGAVILDVRGADEYAKRHIAGAVNIPLVELAAAIEGSPLLVSAEDGSKKVIVVHCASGARSATAASELVAAGFSVVDIGPMDAWQGDGLPPRAEASKQVKCDGCGEVMPDADFQAHCANEDLHNDEFMYTYTAVEAAPVVAIEQAGGAVKLDFATEGLESLTRTASLSRVFSVTGHPDSQYDGEYQVGRWLCSSF
jgi:rhodanese-related sulfurtransferase